VGDLRQRGGRGAGRVLHRIEVILHADGSAEVRDNGRGIPVDVERKTKLTGVELVMTRLHAGGKFGGGSYTASGGLHGVGASVVNALSARLDVEVDRDGQTWAASFRRGVTGEFAGPGPGRGLHQGAGPAPGPPGPEDPEGHRHQDQVLAGPAGLPQGRQVQLRRARRAGPADRLPGARPQPSRVRVPRPAGSRGPGSPPRPASTPRDRCGSRRPGEAAEGPRQAEFRFAGGISEFCAHLASGEKVTEVLRLTGSATFTETVPVLDDRGHMTPTEVERELDVDVALQWGTGYDTWSARSST
jgi:DNA gyrase subunit B